MQISDWAQLAISVVALLITGLIAWGNKRTMQGVRTEHTAQSEQAPKLALERLDATYKEHMEDINKKFDILFSNCQVERRDVSDLKVEVGKLQVVQVDILRHTYCDPKSVK